jgi:hypothetical protein
MKPALNPARAGRLMAVAALVLAALAGCGERAQTAGGSSVGKKGDAPAWDGVGGAGVGSGAIAVAGWKPGDAKVWDEQMRARLQNQNEYTRTTASR